MGFPIPLPIPKVSYLKLDVFPGQTGALKPRKPQTSFPGLKGMPGPLSCAEIVDASWAGFLFRSGPDKVHLFSD